MGISNCIEKITHDKCGSHRGLQVFLKDDGGYNGYCFSCSTFVADPYKDKPEGYAPEVNIKTEEQIQEEIEDIIQYPYVTLHDRKLNSVTLEYFGIRIGLSEADGSTPVSHHYPYYKGEELRAFKNRIIEGKRMWSCGEMKGVDLFGWQQAIRTGSNKLFITEGELDAASLYQMINKTQKGTQYADRTPAVVSLTRGCSYAAQDMSNMATEIRKYFKEIVLVFDGDTPGQDAVQEVLNVFPEAKVAALPCKDANDCLVNGNVKAAVAAVMFNAKSPKNTRLVWGSDLHEAGRQEAEWGFSWPFPALTDMTRGVRLGETYYIGAGPKMGKSEIVNALAAHFITEHGWKVFMAKPEEANRKTYQMVVGKTVNRIFHDPKIEFDYEAYDEGSAKVGDNLCMVNLYQHLGWQTLEADIRAAAAAGCQAIFIDPITNLTTGMAAGEANEMLQQIAVALASMALDLNVCIFMFCHLNNPRDGKEHNRGGHVLSSQFTGSRAMARSCNYMIGLEGNKDPDLTLAERNLRTLVVLEDREFGNTGRVNLSWNPNTGGFTEV